MTSSFLTFLNAAEVMAIYITSEVLRKALDLKRLVHELHKRRSTESCTDLSVVFGKCSPSSGSKLPGTLPVSWPQVTAVKHILCPLP